MNPNAPRKILIIRRDNIRDLVCTLPMVRRLRASYPDSWIGLLVTHYNQEVLRDNPDIDEVFAYTKRKHLAQGESAWRAMWGRLRLLWALRRKGIDLVLLPAEGQQESARRMAKLISARRTLGHTKRPDQQEKHEVQRVGKLLTSLGLPDQDLPAPQLYPRPDLLKRFSALFPANRTCVLGIHISSRKPSQRWPEARFAALIQSLNAQHPSMSFALFWSPGQEDNPLHPGDDEKAARIMQACEKLPVVPIRTESLAELIAGLAQCDLLFCSDGGHMHIASGLSKPIVCLFGKSDAARWHPWGVPHRLLQTSSQEVADISVSQVQTALGELLAEQTAGEIRQL